jgi:hypothetical protein
MACRDLARLARWGRSLRLMQLFQEHPYSAMTGLANHR